MRFFHFSLLFLQLALPAEERVVQSAPIPNRILRQGDALLIQPEFGPRFIRIALTTKHLGKVENKIIAGEKQNWPDSKDSARYLKALRELCAQAVESGEKPVILTINWHPDRVELLYQDRSITLDDLSADYLQKNLRLILIDRFDLSSDEAEILLRNKETR
ncbi:hypothetical protein P0Y35_05245 [Kiritimatiellaeota bacterium B1221]|nr:hypothetical protein [Kiritimatiellaeota bacterium B1221]